MMVGKPETKKEAEPRFREESDEAINKCSTSYRNQKYGEHETRKDLRLYDKCI
jgi:hypothetical protein